jgi:hypothetical protein
MPLFWFLTGPSAEGLDLKAPRFSWWGRKFGSAPEQSWLQNSDRRHGVQRSYGGDLSVYEAGNLYSGGCGLSGDVSKSVGMGFSNESL